MPLSTEAVKNVQSILNGATAEGASGAPGLVFVAVDKAGQTLVEHASGSKGIDSDDPMDLDTVFWLASMTKIVTAIAILQLVEQGKLKLDDPEVVKRYAPEIGKKKVYADGETPAEQEKEVTLRMLLAHTAGFGYSFLDPRVAKIDEFIGDEQQLIDSPMVNQPGSKWEYGTNIDWCGFILERLTGTKLNDYFQEHIFKPLGIKDMTMFPPSEMQSKLAHMHQRDEDGNLRPREFLWSFPFHITTKEDEQKAYHAGGAGLFGKPREYVKILAALANNGTSPTTGSKILSSDTVNLMWENQIPDQPDFGRAGLPPANPLLANQTPEFYPQGDDRPPQGWGLSMFLTITPGFTGRGANTGWWAGLANTYWWVDRERGVAGVIAGQVLPFGDAKVVGTWFATEKAVYDGLQA